MKLRLNLKVAGMAVIGCLAAMPALAEESGTDQDVAWHNRQMIALAERQTEDGWQWMNGGLLWRRIAGDGTGNHPSVNDVVTLHYAGTLVDGTQFDSSYTRNTPATFPLAALIPAWQIAVPQMGVGDTIEIAAPSDLAYGPRGKGPIPGGATLLFKIELLAISGQTTPSP